MAAGDLCGVPDVLAWLPSQTGQAAEPLIESLITAASRLVCNYCGRASFASQAYTDLVDGTGREWLLLRQWPVSAVASIALSNGWAAPRTITDPAAYLLEQPIPSGANQRLTLLAGERFPRGRSNVQVNYTAGFDAIPGDVAQACIELVGEAYRRREHIGQLSVAMPNQVTTSFSQADMNATVRTLLASYRRLVPC